MEFKTLEEVASWMSINIRLSRYDQQFVDNLTSYSMIHNRITTNQDSLFRKIAKKYNRQFLHQKKNIDEWLTLPWQSPIVPSAPEYTNASIQIVDDKIIFRAPYKKEFLSALKKEPIYTLEWVKENREYQMKYGHTILKKLVYLSADHFDVVNYCHITLDIINSLGEYEDAKYWSPTLKYNDGLYYIAALNEALYEHTKNIPFSDDLKTISTLASYGIKMDQSVIDHLCINEDPLKVKFAASHQVEFEIRDIATALFWLYEFGCDAVCEPRTFMKNNVILKDVYKQILNEAKIALVTDHQSLRQYENPAVFFYKGSFMTTESKPLKLMKMIRLVNSDPVDLGPK